MNMGTLLRTKPDLGKRI